MMKLLDIIITHYDEPWEIVRPGIDLLRNQVSYDPNQVRVTIVHDGSGPFKEIDEEEFPFEIRQVGIAHGGVSKARNYGIDISDAKWVTFYDCDDSLSCIYSLGIILRALNTENFNFLWHAFSATSPVDPTFPSVPIPVFNAVWMAAKYFRLSFLRGNGIRFNEKLGYSEDGAFSKVAYLHCKEQEIGEIQSEYPLYTWRRRQDSATMNAQHYIRNLLHGFRANRYVSEEFLKCKRPTTGLMMARTVTDAYVSLNRILTKEHPYGEKQLTEEVLDFIKTYRGYLKPVTKKQWEYVLDASENEGKRTFALDPNREDFYIWYERMKQNAY